MLKAIVDMRQILQNVNQIKEKSHKQLIVVVKSDAYNTGALNVAKYLENNGYNYFAVVNLTEAKELISGNIKSNILVLNSVYLEDLDYIDKHQNIIVSVNSINDAIILKDYKFNRCIKVHLQIETGMNRLGLKTLLDAKQAINFLKENTQIIIEGIYTHYTSLKNMNNQEHRFNEFINLEDFKVIHCGATPTYTSSKVGNYVRVGLDVYGDTCNNQSLSIYTHPIQINHISAGETVGYNELYKVIKDEVIAVLPIGYNDGLSRNMTKVNLYANGKYYPIIGAVCMNHCFVLVDETIDLNTPFFFTSKENPASVVAKHINTISYEILCMLKTKDRQYKI